MKTLLNSTCALLIFSAPAFAQLQAEPPHLEDDMLAFLTEVGADLKWENRIHATGMTIFQNASINRYGRSFDIEDLRTDGENITAKTVRVFKEEGGDGTVAVDIIEMSNVKSFMDLFEFVNAIPVPNNVEEVTIDIEALPEIHFGEICGGLTSNAQLSYGWSAQGVRIAGDMDALPDSFSKSEEIRFENFRQNHEIKMENGACDHHTQAAFLGMNIVAIDGAHISLTGGSLGLLSSGSLIDEIYTEQVALKLEDLSLSDSGGLVSASLDDFSVSYVTDNHMDLLVCDILFLHDQRESSEMLHNALSTRSGGRVSISGIDISVPHFFPPYIIEAMGLSDKERIAGDLLLQGTVDDGLLITQGSVDIPELLSTTVDARLALPGSLDVTLPGFIAAHLPIPGELLDVQIQRFAFSYQDQGIGDIISLMTGQSPSEIFDQNLELLQARVDDRIPRFVSEKLSGARDVVSRLLRSGGSIVIEPEAPQTVMGIAMQGMMNPAGMNESMGVAIDISE